AQRQQVAVAPSEQPAPPPIVTIPRPGPAPQPTPPSAVVAQPPAPLIPASPLVSASVTLPLGAAVDQISATLVPSSYIGVAKKPANSNLVMEVWKVPDADEQWTRVGEVSVPSSTARPGFAVSPDGTKVAYLATFPKPMLQIRTLADGQT